MKDANPEFFSVCGGAAFCWVESGSARLAATFSEVMCHAYITPSMVTVMGAIERRYELQAGRHGFLIIEDLRPTNCLPVTIS